MTVIFVADSIYPFSPPSGVSLSNYVQFLHLHQFDSELILITNFKDMTISLCYTDFIEFCNNPSSFKPQPLIRRVSRAFCIIPFLFINSSFSLYSYISSLKPDFVFISCLQTGLSESFIFLCIFKRIPFSIISHGVSIFPRYFSLLELLRFAAWLPYLIYLPFFVFKSFSIFQLPFSPHNISFSALLRRIDFLICPILRKPTVSFLPSSPQLDKYISNPSYSPISSSLHQICWIGSSSHIKNFSLFIQVVSHFPNLSFATLDNISHHFDTSAHPNLHIYSSLDFSGQDVISKSDSLLITSFSEVFPVVALEALVCSKLIFTNYNTSLSSLNHPSVLFYKNSSYLLQLITRLFIDKTFIKPQVNHQLLLETLGDFMAKPFHIP